MKLPEGQYLACDWSNGTVTTFTRETAERYLAVYGRPRAPWRAATAEEIQQHLEEVKRLAALGEQP